MASNSNGRDETLAATDPPDPTASNSDGRDEKLAATDPPDPKTVFPFFDLPKELRLIIYNYSTEDLYAAQYPNGDDNAAAVCVFVKNALLTNILCLNRQANREYTDEMSKTTIAICSDHEDFDFNQPLFKAPPAVYTSLESFEYRGFIRCKYCAYDVLFCQAAEDVRDTTKWLKSAIQNFDKLRNLDITIGLWCPSDTDSIWPESPHASELQTSLQDMSDIPKLTTLRIYICNEDSYEADDISEYSRKKYATWTKQDGWKAEEAEDSSEDLSEE